MNFGFSYEEPLQFNVEVTEPETTLVGDELTEYVLEQRVKVCDYPWFIFRHIYIQ